LVDPSSHSKMSRESEKLIPIIEDPVSPYTLDPEAPVAPIGPIGPVGPVDPVDPKL